MDSAVPSPALSVHEFPDGPLLVGDWKRTHLAYLLGHTTQRQPLTQSVIHRMHHLHISRIRWYKTTPLIASDRPRTFELASGSHWEAAPAAIVGPDVAGRVAQLALPAQHQHHYVLAEVCFPISAAEGASTPVNIPGKIEGYLRIEGDCGPSSADSHRTSSSSNASHIPRRPSRLTAGMMGLRSLAVLDPPAISSLIDLVESSPVPRRRSTRSSETTPTGLETGIGEDLSPKGSGTSEDLFAFRPQEGSSVVEEPEVDLDESADAVPAQLDFSYLTKRSNSGSATSSSPFISPFASRSSSIARSRGSRGSTDTNRSQATQPNSRSNSSSATSFSTSSSFSLSSAGLMFSDNPLNRVGETAGDTETRFLVSYPGPHFVGFGSPKHGPGMGSIGDTEECVLELSFPGTQDSAPSSQPEGDEPRGFLTLRDLTILADLVERSLHTENDDADTHPDNTSVSGASDESGNTDPMDMSIVDPSSITSTCCCEYYSRLFSIIRQVSGLRESLRSAPDESKALSSALSDMSIDDAGQDAPNHYDLYAHHGRYLKAPFGEQEDRGSTAEAPGHVRLDATIESLKAKFERKKVRFERELTQIVRPHSYYDPVERESDTPKNSTPTARASHSGRNTTTVPASALEEANLADERFRLNVIEMQSTSP